MDQLPTSPEPRQRAGALPPLDLDPSRRPGVPMMRAPQPWPHSIYPPERQAGKPSAPKHGRPGKQVPPVFGTSVPARGLAGAIRKAAYRYPDHWARHWMMLLFADRVDSATSRTRKLLPYAGPAAIFSWVAMRRVVAPSGRAIPPR